MVPITFEERTGRSQAPTTVAREVWAIVGRRGGKSIIAALVVYLPNLALVALIVGVGFLISGSLEARVSETLAEEGVTRARVIGKAE